MASRAINIASLTVFREVAGRSHGNDILAFPVPSGGYPLLRGFCRLTSYLPHNPKNRPPRLLPARHPPERDERDDPGPRPGPDHHRSACRIPLPHQPRITPSHLEVLMLRFYEPSHLAPSGARTPLLRSIVPRRPSPAPPASGRPPSSPRRPRTGRSPPSPAQTSGGRGPPAGATPSPAALPS